MDDVISSELKDFDIRSSSKDNFKPNLNCTIDICKTFANIWRTDSLMPLLETFSESDSTNWPSEYLPGDGEGHIDSLLWSTR